MSLESKSTDFIPSKHGFHFANDFYVTWDMFELEGNGSSWNLGLCGGMCFAALDRFYRSEPMPVLVKPPAEGTELFKELLEREISSLVPIHWEKFYELQCLADSGPNDMATLGLKSKIDLPTIMKSIEEERPKTLGLICVEGPDSNPTDNHQVLAIGYRCHTDSKDYIFNIYDPNYPDEDDIYISMNTALTDNAIKISHSKGDPIRGLFAIKYFPPEIKLSLTKV